MRIYFDCASNIANHSYTISCNIFCVQNMKSNGVNGSAHSIYAAVAAVYDAATGYAAQYRTLVLIGCSKSIGVIYSSLCI